MAYKYLFKLNEIELQDVQIGVDILEKLEEPMDEAGLHLPLTLLDYEYDMRGLLVIQMRDEYNTYKEFNFLVISDRVNVGSKYGEWIHDLLVLEYTHKFDMYLIHAMTFTKPLISERNARFRTYRVNECGLSAIGMRAFVQLPKVQEEYFANQPITFKQVPQANVAVGNEEVSGGYFESVLTDVYIKYTHTDLSGTVTTQTEVLSDDDVTWTFTQGSLEIEISIGNEIPELDDYQYITYYSTIIKETKFTLLEALNILRDIKPLESVSNHIRTRIFNIDPEYTEFFSKIEIPQLFIQKATMRQVLNSIFLYINAISRLKYQEVNLDLLSIDEFNKIVDDFVISDVSTFSTSQDGMSLFNRGVSWLERALPNNLENATMSSPSQENYKSVRSKEIQITQDKFELKLDRQNYEIKKFTTLIRNLRIYTDVGFGEFIIDELELDLTDRMLNKNEWSLKLITPNFPTYTPIRPFYDFNQFPLDTPKKTTLGLRDNKASNLYWEQGASSISLSDVFGEAVQTNVVFSTILEALYEWLIFNIQPYINPSNSAQRAFAYYVTWGENNIFDTFPLTGDNSPSKLFRNLEFNVEYITIENINAISHREDLSISPYYTEGRINQSDKQINIELATRKSYGDLQRSGVPTRVFEKYHDDFSTLYELGMQDLQGFIITQRNLELHNQYILAKYIATKDHNRLSEFIGLDQAYRAFEIPTSNQVYERIESYVDYIFITKPLEEIESSGGSRIVGSPTTDLILGVLINDWKNSTTEGKTKISNAYVRTDGFLEEYPDGDYIHAISTPVSTFGIKGGFIFSFGFESNQIAGDGVSYDEENENYYNSAVRYTDRRGFFRYLWFALTTTNSIGDGDDWTLEERLQQYPLVRVDNDGSDTILGSEDDWYFSCGTTDFSNFGFDGLVIHKDTSQSFKLNYQVSFMAKDFKEYVIGQKFYTDNFIVKNPNIQYGKYVGVTKYLYIYETLTTYNLFDDLKIKSGWNSKVEITDSNSLISAINLGFTGSLATAIASGENWAIGDNDGNLYLACNDNSNGFYFHLTHFRPNEKEIGNKQQISLNKKYLDLEISTLNISISEDLIGTAHPFRVISRELETLNVLVDFDLDGTAHKLRAISRDLDTLDILFDVDFVAVDIQPKNLDLGTLDITSEFIFEGTTSALKSVSMDLETLDILGGFDLDGTAQKPKNLTLLLDLSITFNSSVNGDITLFPPVYTINFYGINGTTLLSSQEIEEGSNATPPTPPTVTGYTFNSWNSTAYLNVTADANIIALYDINQYKVQFIDWFNFENPIVLKTEYVDYGGSATAPVDPEKTGYTFTGWDRAFTFIVSDLNVYADWSKNYYTVTFNANGGTTPNPTSKEVGYDEAYGTLATTSRTGYTFNGWFTATSGGTQILSTTKFLGTSNQTLYAQWTLQTFTVTFKDFDGTTLKTETVNYGEDATAPSVSRTGYTFTSWSHIFTNVTSNVTTTAQYTARTFTVTLDKQSGTGGTSSVTATYDSAMPSATAPTRTNYEFLGYYTGTNGSGTKYYNANMSSARNWDITSNTTLYAYWNKVTPTDWVQTSNTSYNGSYSYMTGTTCDSLSGVDDKLTTNRPVGDYSIGFIMRVTHFTSDEAPCTTYYFQAQ